jgi:tripartite-type tricarboxylate transporter receptor subunit TctC
MAEVGLPQVDAKLWYAFLAPGKTPADRVGRLNAAFAEAGKTLGSEKQLQRLGFSVEMRDPESLAKLIKDETARWRKVIAFNNIPLED